MGESITDSSTNHIGGLKMSLNNSDREYYYNLYLRFHKYKLEEVLGINLSELELEKNFNGRRVDIYTYSDERDTFIESQITSADTKHLNQILHIIQDNEVNSCIVIWIALSFKPFFLDRIEAEIKKVKKNISFFALELNSEILDYLNILNTLPILEVVDNLKILNNVKVHLKLIQSFYRFQNIDEQGNPKITEVSRPLDLSIKGDIMQCLLNETRKQLGYYPSIYRYKKLDNSVIVIAGGKVDVNFYLGLNAKNYLYVEIRFQNSAKEIFNRLLEIRDTICDKFDYFTEFDCQNSKIGTYIYYRQRNRELLIKQIVRITDKYIRYFTQYTLNKEKVSKEILF